MLEAHHEVIRETRDHDITTRVPTPPLVSPQVEDVVQVDVRKQRGLGRPETFRFLGFTHICARSKSGRFKLKRITDSKRLQAKLRSVKTELMRRRHQPIPEQGEWLASVLRGHANYGVPDNSQALLAFRHFATEHWYRALRRRSQRTRLTWERMRRLRDRWLPSPKITHPWPTARFDARTQGRSPVR